MAAVSTVASLAEKAGLDFKACSKKINGADWELSRDYRKDDARSRDDARSVEERARSQHRRYPYWYEGFYLNLPGRQPGEYPCVLRSISDKPIRAHVPSR